MSKTVLLIFVTSIMVSCSHSNKWSYNGKKSEYYWGELKDEYQECKNGTHQSPINLNINFSKKLNEKVKFHYKQSDVNVVNNGHTVEFDFKQKNYVELNKKKYELLQLHFHSHSEHTLNKEYYPAEMHLVHKNKNGELLVIAFFIELDENHHESFHFLSKIPTKKFQSIKQNIHLESLLNLTGTHFSYKGSLTTPPCTEGVHWVIFDKHITVKPDQLKHLTAFYTKNFRNIQKKKKHTLQHSEI